MIVREKKIMPLVPLFSIRALVLALKAALAVSMTSCTAVRNQSGLHQHPVHRPFICFTRYICMFLFILNFVPLWSAYLEEPGPLKTIQGHLLCIPCAMAKLQKVFTLHNWDLSAQWLAAVHPPCHWELPFCSESLWVFLFLMPHVSAIMPYLSVCGCHISLGTATSGFFHALADGKISSLS